MEKRLLIANYNKIFGDEGTKELFFAPSRVNMIGEHIDYNGGYVFPCALSFGTYGVASLRKDKRIKMYSENFSDIGVIDVSIDELEFKKEHNWTNYVKGVLVEFMKKAKINQGMNIYIFGDMPYSAGLSSSASLEMLVSIMFNDLYNINLEMLDMVKMAKVVENEYMGVNSGIMDQFAIGMGKKDAAMYLNTATLECTYTPLILNDYEIVIANTNKKRTLADSKYNERKQECDSSLEKIQKIKQIEHLCDLSTEDFDSIKHVLSDIEQRRTYHVLSENERTKMSVKVLNQNDIKMFGKLMYQSHVSLRDDYDVTGKELDTLVHLMMSQEGVVGSRMTGAGFGGCTVSIVAKEFIKKTITKVSKEYKDIIGYDAEFYVISVGPGVHKL